MICECGVDHHADQHAAEAAAAIDPIAEAIVAGDELRAESEADAQDEQSERNADDNDTREAVAEIEADASVAIAEAQADAAVAIAEADAAAAVAIAEALTDESGEDELPPELDDGAQVDELPAGEAEEVTAIEIPPQITEANDGRAAAPRARTTSAFHARRVRR